MDKITRLRKIVAEKQMGKVEGRKVDLFSASAIVAVHDKLNPENQTKFLAMPVYQMADVAFKLLNRGK